MQNGAKKNGFTGLKKSSQLATLKVMAIWPMHATIFSCSPLWIMVSWSAEIMYLLHSQNSYQNPVPNFTTVNFNTHPFNGSFSWTTQVSQYQKGKNQSETVSSSGISWAICKSAPCSRLTPCQHPTTQFFTDRMPFLPPNQQLQSTEVNFKL